MVNRKKQVKISQYEEKPILLLKTHIWIQKEEFNFIFVYVYLLLAEIKGKTRKFLILNI
jgi:hypothetical protein